MKLKGMVFDLDGTLVDSLAVTFDAFNFGITHHGGRVHTPHEIMAHFGSGEDKIFEKIVGTENGPRAYQSFIEYMTSHLTEVPLHEGVDELLRNARQEKIPVSIVTGRSWNTTEAILKHHGILDQFVTVIADDHVELPKPSPLGIQLALTRMNLKPSEVFYVGDSVVDIQAAKNAGTQGVAALWDLLVNRPALEQHQPHHWVEHPREVWSIWKSLA